MIASDSRAANAMNDAHGKLMVEVQAGAHENGPPVEWRPHSPEPAAQPGPGPGSQPGLQASIISSKKHYMKCTSVLRRWVVHIRDTPRSSLGGQGGPLCLSGVSCVGGTAQNCGPPMSHYAYCDIGRALKFLGTPISKLEMGGG